VDISSPASRSTGRYVAVLGAVDDGVLAARPAAGARPSDTGRGSLFIEHLPE
jgi:hypothetical protein